MQKTCSMNPLKQKMTMKKNSFLWAALSMTAALVMTACSNDDNDMTEAPVAPSTSKTIPYTVTVGGDEATTRATVDGNNKTLYFATDDKLYITGENIQGVLSITDGVGESSGATFSGELTYTGDAPADDLALTATLVSEQQTVGNQVSVDGNGAVTVNYPDNAYCTSINDAVQKYSNLTGTSTYGAKAFELTQMTAFLNFEITVTGGTSGTTLPANVISNGESIAKANVTTVTDNGVKAKFVLPVAVGTSLTSATVKLGGIEIGSAIGDASLSSGKVYNVTRTVNMSSVTLAQTKTTADMTVKVHYYYADEENYCQFLSNGDGTYTFQSGDGWAGGDADCAKALVVDNDGKLVFKQNRYNTIEESWNMAGFSVTIDTSNNTYSEWFGKNTKGNWNPSFISVEVNGKEIELTEAEAKITVDDLDKEDGWPWFMIVESNSDKIYIDYDDGGRIKRSSDNAKLLQDNGGGWTDVTDGDGYDSSITYKFEGD